MRSRKSSLNVLQVITFTIIAVLLAAQDTNAAETCEANCTACSQNHRIIPMTQAMKDRIIKFHNEVRSNVSLGRVEGHPAAGDMHEMHYDDKIQPYAECRVLGCPKYSLKNCVTRDGLYLHQNYYLLQLDTVTDDYEGYVQQILDAWAAEQIYVTFSKLPYYVDTTGHSNDWTQMIWSKTTRVGCGLLLLSPGAAPVTTELPINPTTLDPLNPPAPPAYTTVKPPGPTLPPNNPDKTTPGGKPNDPNNSGGQPNNNPNAGTTKPSDAGTDKKQTTVKEPDEAKKTTVPTTIKTQDKAGENKREVKYRGDEQDQSGERKERGAIFNKYGVMMMCEYNPAGNMNRRPVYMRGVPCTLCPESYSKCDPSDGLCRLGGGGGGGSKCDKTPTPIVIYEYVNVTIQVGNCSANSTDGPGPHPPTKHPPNPGKKTHNPNRKVTPRKRVAGKQTPSNAVRNGIQCFMFFVVIVVSILAA